MPQFDYLGSWEDSWKIVGTLLERPATVLFLDCWYERPEPLRIVQLGEAEKQLIRQWRGLYIWATDFSRFPLQFSRATRLYRISSNEGGPCLNFSVPACYERDGTVNLALGIFTHSREYLNPETGEWELATPSVTRAYKEILDLIKQHLVRHKFHKPIWIGRHALDLVLCGKARIRGFGLPE
jgi:hypothetical protein